MPHNSELPDYLPLTRASTSKGFGGEASLEEWKRVSEQRWETKPGIGEQNVPDPQAELIKDQATPAKPSKSLMIPQLLKRGHALSFFGLSLFTAFVFFRPYELIPSLMILSSSAKWLAILTLIAFVPTQLGLEGNLTSRPREVNLVLLLALAALLSVPLALNAGEAWDHVTEYLKIVTMFVVLVNVVRTERRLRFMLLIALAASLLMSVAAFMDYRAGRLLVGGVRVKGIIGGLFDNPNDLAGHLVTMVPLAISLLLCRPGILRKLSYGLCAFFMVAAIIVTFSRGGFLGLVAAMSVLLWKLGRRNRFAYFIIAGVVVIVFLALAPSDYSGRVASIFDSSLDVLGSSTSRWEQLIISLKVALRNPLLGIGMGNFHIVANHEQVSHNAFTQVAAELGIAACVVYTMFIVTPLKRLRHLERETLGVKEHARFYYLAVGLQASLIGYMVSSFFASVAFLWYVYYLVGYAFCLSRMYAAIAATQQLSTVAPEPAGSVSSGWAGQALPKAEAL